MSFYGSRMSGFGAHLYADGAPVFFNPRRRMGLLPSLAAGGGTYVEKVRGSVAQLLAQATQIQGRYLDLFRTPEGAAAGDTAKSFDDTINAAWNDVVAIGAQIDALGPMPVALSQEQIDQIIDQNFDPSYGSHAGANAGYIAQDKRNKEISDWSDNLNALVFQLNNSNAPKLRDYLQAYITNVPSVAGAAQAVIDSKTQHATAITDIDTAKAKIQLEHDRANLAKATQSANAAIKAISGPSPMMIALIALPVVGLGAYLLLKRKKTAAVGRYHRRRR